MPDQLLPAVLWVNTLPTVYCLLSCKQCIDPQDTQHHKTLVTFRQLSENAGFLIPDGLSDWCLELGALKLGNWAP